MMKHLQLFVVLVGVSLSSFYLNANEFKSRVSLDGHSKSLLKRVVFDHIEFKDTPISKIFAYIQKRSKEIDPRKEGISYMLYLKDRTKEIVDPRISIVADDISMSKLINYICKKADLSCYIEKNTVIVAYNFYPYCAVETRIYPIEQQAVTELGGEDDEEAVRLFFERRGVPFPKGTAVVYDNRISRLIVTNTPDNLVKVEAIIGVLNIVDPQVLIELHTVKIKQKDFLDIIAKPVKKSDKGIPKNKWRMVINSDKAELIASTSVVTLNGQEAVIRSVQEKYYPEEWSDSQSNGSEEGECKKEEQKPAKKELRYPGVPSFGDPTELGAVLRVTPNVDADNFTVSLDMNPVMQIETGVTEFKIPWQKLYMPKIKALTVETNVTIYDGEVLPLNVNLQNSTNGRDEIYTFLSVRLLNPSGEPVRFLSKIERRKFSTRNDLDAVKGYKRSPLISKYMRKVLGQGVSLELSHSSLNAAFKNIQENYKKKYKEVLPLELKDRVKEDKLFSCNITDIRCDNIFKYMAMLSGFVYKIINGKAVFQDPKKENLTEHMETKSFKVRVALISSLMCTSEGGEGEDEDDDLFEKESSIVRYTKEIKDPNDDILVTYFSDRGVPFPKGAWIRYSRKYQRIFVRNTPENLRRMASLLRDLDIVTPLILIEFSMVEIDQQDLGEVTGVNNLTEPFLCSKSDIENIMASSKSKIVAAAKVIATSGSTAVTRLVDQHYFPESWTEPEVDAGKKKLEELHSYPEFGDPTDIGFRFEVTPTVSPNNYTISLELNPQQVKFAGWSKYDYQLFNKKTGKMEALSVKMPELDRHDMSANIKVYDSIPIMIGRFQAGIDSDGKMMPFFNNALLKKQLSSKYVLDLERPTKNLFFFVKARLISGDGNFVRE